MRHVDILGFEPKIYIKGETAYKTALGGVISVVTIVLTLSFFGYFLYELFSRHNFQVISWKNSNFEKKIDLSNTPLIFKIANIQGEILNPNVVNIIGTKWEYFKENKGVPVITKINLVKCDLMKQGRNSKDDMGSYTHDFLSLPDIETFYCLSNLSNLTLWGSDGDYNNGFAKFLFYVATCSNDTILNSQVPSGKCLPSNEIAAELNKSSPVLFMGIVDYEINHNNLTQPISRFINNNRLHMSVSSGFKYNVHLTKVFYISDDGFMLQSLKEFSSYQLENMESTQILGNTFYYPNAVGVLMFDISQKAEFFSRGYTKLQTAVANIGGVLTALIATSRCILHYFSANLLLKEYAHSNFIFQDSRPQIIDNHIHIEQNCRNTIVNPNIHNSNNKSHFFEPVMNHIPICSNSVNMNNFVNKNIGMGLNNKNVMIVSDNGVKNKKFELGFRDLICPRCCYRKSKDSSSAIRYELCESIIKKKLSMENLLLIMNQFALLKTFLLDETQQEILNHVKRRTLEDELNYYQIEGLNKFEEMKMHSMQYIKGKEESLVQANLLQPNNLFPVTTNIQNNNMNYFNHNHKHSSSGSHPDGHVSILPECNESNSKCEAYRENSIENEEK